MSSKAVETVYGSMPSHLSCASLKDLCLDGGIQTGPFGSQLHQEDYVESGIPIITVEHLGENRIIHSNLPQVSDQDKARLSKYVLKAGDIVFSRVGSVDRRALVQPAEDGWLFSGRCLRVRPNAEKLDAQWLSYFFGLPAFKNYIRGIAVGATMPSLNTKILSDVPIYFPDLNAQKDAASILSIIDDRITLLRETNETLEAIAQALFKSWFVDFDPVRAKTDGKLPDGIDAATAELFPDAFEESELGLVPKGWRVGTVESICDTITNGGTPSRSNKEYWTDGEIPWFKTGELSDGFLLAPSERITQLAIASTSVKVLPPNAVLMAIYAAPTVGRLGILTEPAAFNQACTGMVPKQVIGSWFLYWTLYFGRDWFNSRANGAAQQNISKVIVSNFKLVIPDERVLDAFKIICDALHSKIRTSSIQAQTLSNLRDTLLPRLISGQLHIADAEAELEKAIA